MIDWFFKIKEERKRKKSWLSTFCRTGRRDLNQNQNTMFRIYLKQCSVDYISNLENDFIAGWQWDWLYIFAIYKKISWQGDSGIDYIYLQFIKRFHGRVTVGLSAPLIIYFEFRKRFHRWVTVGLSAPVDYISNLENDFIAGWQWDWAPRWLYIEFRKRFHGGVAVGLSEENIARLSHTAAFHWTLSWPRVVWACVTRVRSLADAAFAEEEWERRWNSDRTEWMNKPYFTRVVEVDTGILFFCFLHPAFAYRGLTWFCRYSHTYTFQNNTPLKRQNSNSKHYFTDKTCSLDSKSI